MALRSNLIFLNKNNGRPKCSVQKPDETSLSGGHHGYHHGAGSVLVD